MSLVNQMLRDLDEQKRINHPVSTNALMRNVRTASSPLRDSRFMMAVVMLATLFFGGAIKAWNAIDDAQQTDSFHSNLNTPLETETPPLKLPEQVAVKSTQKEHQTAVEVTTDTLEKTKKDNSNESPAGVSMEAKITADGIKPISEQAPISTSTNGKVGQTPCCQGNNCPKQSNKTISLDCNLSPVDSNAPGKSKKTSAMHVSVFEKKLRPLTKKQRSEKLYQQGYVNTTQNRIDLARTNLESALQLNPENIEVRLLLADVYIKTNDSNLAARLLDKGLEKHPKETRLAMQRARLHLQHNEISMAIKILTHGLNNAGADSGYFAFLAALYQRQAQHQRAINMYQRALSMAPGTSKWWIGLAMSLEEIERLQDSLRAYRQAFRDKTLPPKVLEYIRDRISALVAYNQPAKQNLRQHG